MASPLLKTKLHIPPARPQLVARPRLIHRLDQALTRPLTLLSAPPGFGKTTLLTAWLAQQPLPAAWYSLDERDDDLARFLAYLVAALETVHPEVGRRALSRLHARRMPPLETVMTLLSNDLAAVPRDFILVLDDYHLVELPAIHAAVAFLLEPPPPPLHLVIAARADPPLPLARLRAGGQLVELRAPDLRFTLDEAAAFLNAQMDLSLTPDQVAALDARAEGWIAGLQLAALSMQGRQDAAGFIKAFAGSHHFVLDYLGEEVWRRQTPEVQSFLLQTCILEQMNASLADAVTGRNDSAQMLAQLEKANLFVVPLDDARQWYRYHHLFADLLESRLQQSPPELVAEVHRRAATWYEQNGFTNEAIDHALAARDFERAARLIEGTALALLLRSENTTILRWSSSLPDDLVRARPFLGLIQAAALMTLGKIESGFVRLAQVDQTRLDPAAREMAAMLQSAMWLLRADVPQAIETARSALERADAARADPADPQAEIKTTVTLYLATILAELQIASGQLRAAAATCRRGIEVGNALPAGSPWALILGFIRYQLAELLYEWNELDAAEQEAAHALEICRAGRNEEIESYALVALALVRQARGDGAGALEWGEQALRLSRKRDVAGETWYMAARLVKALVAAGRVSEAAQVVSELPPEDEDIWVFERGSDLATRARVLIAQREFDRAVEALDLAQQAEAAAQRRMPVELFALSALARQGQGRTAQAATDLARALSLAELEGYVRTFVDLGEPMRLMISDLRFSVDKNPEAETLIGYADRLLAAFPAAISETNPPTIEAPQGTTAEPPVAVGKSALAEPLSERERVVLRLIAEGLSNQEIAERLVVAVSTVKTHINNIYGKLGAGSRTQALARARERGLL